MRTLLRLAVPALAGLVSIAAQAEGPRIHVTPYAPLFGEEAPGLGVRTGDLVRRELAAQEGVVVAEPAAPAAGPQVEAAKALERARTLAEQGWAALEPPAPEASAPEAEPATDAAPAAGGPVLPAASGGPVLPAAQGPVTPADDADAPADDADESAAVAEAPAAPEPDPAEAAARFQAAIRLLEQHPEVLGDLSLLTELYRGRAIALALAGQPGEAEAALADLARWAPDAEPDWRAAAQRLGPAWERVRGQVLSGPRGAIEAKGVPFGAEVRLDGEPVGKLPLRLTGLVPGAHWVSVSAAKARPWARRVEVVADEAVELAPRLEGFEEGPTATLLTALAANRLDEAAVAAAVEAGRAHEAAFVVTGALSRAEDAFRVRSYLVEVDGGRVSALPEMSFDLDLIGAAIEVYQLATGVTGQVGAEREALALPVTPFPDARPAPLELEVVNAGPPAPKSGPVLPGADGAEAREGTEGTSEGAVAEATEPAKPAGPLGPIVAQESEAQAPQRRERKGPLAAGAIELDDAEDGTEDAAAASTGPVGPVGPVAPTEPADEEQAAAEAGPRERQVASISGDRERLDLGAAGDPNRFSAVDVEDIVIPKDEVGEEEGWPWWAYGLVAAGVVAAGAGGYFAAQQAGVFGGTPSDATVSIRW